MWAASALVVIACGRTVFTVRFLIALLWEGSASVCYWVIPVVAAEGEERAQEVFETGLEFDVRISHGRYKLSTWALAGGESLGSNGTNGTLESGRKEGVRTNQAGRRDAAAVGFVLVVLLIVAGAEAPRSDAQTEPQQPAVQSAKLNDAVQPPSAQPARDAAAPDKSRSSAKPADAPKRIA